MHLFQRNNFALPYLIFCHENYLSSKKLFHSKAPAWHETVFFFSSRSDFRSAAVVFVQLLFLFLCVCWGGGGHEEICLSIKLKQQTKPRKTKVCVFVCLHRRLCRLQGNFLPHQHTLTHFNTWPLLLLLLLPRSSLSSAHSVRGKQGEQDLPAAAGFVLRGPDWAQTA